ncbi:choline transporter-like protein 4 isoform X2 [Hydra vulgaris]|uniref:Choline transporter-like protein n=1 Tax=Hydra vulgaris TaxID=6087 RepID=A0ABM4BF41_HYDVU
MTNEGKEKAENSRLINQEFGQKKKYDKNFKGPIKDRGCTDIICCVLFSIYMIGMIIVGIVAYMQGDPKRLLFPTDSNGKVCGVDIIGKSFLHYFDLTKCITKGTADPLEYARNGLACPTPKVCVSKCPHLNAAGFDVPFDEMICIAGVQILKNTSNTEKKQLVQAGKCSPYYLQSKAVFYRCVPEMLANAITSLGIINIDGTKVNGSNIELGKDALQILLNFRNLGMQIADELKVVWVWILIGLIIAMVASMLYIILARWITFPLVVFTSLGVLGLIGYGIYYSFAKYKLLVDTKSSVDIVWRMSIKLSDFAANKNAWLILGITLAVIFLILFLIMIFLFHRVRIACELIAETSRAVCSMLSTLFFPLLPWILQIAWFAWFIVVLLFLMSNGIKQYQVSADDNTYNLTMGKACSLDTFSSLYPKTNVTCLFAKYSENVNLFRFQVFHLFGWLWGSQFIIAFTECSLAGAFASYYWAMRKPQDIPSFPVFGGMWRSLSYHTGSLALGAAIIAVVKLIRITLEYIDRKLKENTNNPVASFIMKCLKCCFWCLEKCLRFLNKNAYIMIAVYGRNFCASAKEAFSLLVRNPARAVTINGITGFVLFLGKILVTGGIGVGSFFWFAKYNAFLPDKLHYSIVPVLICTIGAYLVAMLFFSVYDMGIDTLFLCFLEDLERNDGSDEKPYFMSKELRNIMDVKNKPAPSNDISMSPKQTFNV